MDKTTVLAALVMVAMMAVTAQAQDAPVDEAPVEEAAEAASEEEAEPAEPAPEVVEPEEDAEAVLEARKAAETRAAQEKVEKARKLIKIQRYDEAIVHLQDAYLVLEDPELLRMLGEVHEAKGEGEAAKRFYGEYLADPRVGEMSKASVRKKRDALVADAEKDKGGKDDDGGSFWDDWLDWESAGAASGTAGRLYLTLGARFSHNPGAEFSERRGGDGPEQDAQIDEQWVHGGGGGELEVGAFIYDAMSMGLSFGLDFMRWENRRFQEAFETEYTSGLRPSLALNLRYHFGWGFHFGATFGGDLVIVTDAPNQLCGTLQVDCPTFEVSTGPQGFRVAYGALMGYRAFITDDWSLGMDFGLRQVPLFIRFNGASVTELPSYTDSSLLFNGAVVVNWNL